MKVIVAEPVRDVQTPHTPRSWYFVADSSLVNTGKPFFIPEFADETEAFLMPVIRINRIGKSIGSRFASRYYSEMAMGVHFRASALRRELISKGLPPDAAHSFDRSMTVGEFLPAEEMLDKVVSLKVNGEVRAEWRDSGFVTSAGDFLEAVSRSNTVKMGDYIIPELCGPVPVRIGDLLTVETPGNTLFEIHIR